MSTRDADDRFEQRMARRRQRLTFLTTAVAAVAIIPLVLTLIAPAL